MSFGKEIYTLLLQHDIVIIPGLGAFVSEYQPAEISENSDEIKPPSKTVSFNPQLKNNDGLLVGHIAEKLHIAHFEALVRIEKEREDILFKLDKGQKVEFEGVGTFLYDKEGKIEFQASEEENMLLDSFGLEPMSMREPEPEPEPEVIPEEAPAPVVEPEITEAAELNEEPQETQQEEEKHVEEEIKEEETTTEEPKIEESQPTPPPVKEEEKKKSKAWLLLLILIPLIAVAGFIFYKGYYKADSELITPEYTQQEITEEPAQIIPDTINTDSLEINVADTLLATDSVENIPVEEEEVAEPSVKYYLVGGSFSVKENADTYLQELQQKGYDAFHVGKKGRFFIVGIASYNTFSEADSAKTKYMEDNPGSEVWVYRK
ncbi:SPOR domain-containing protein [Draconibacterium sp. IB214405]|uniref:HU domain-containing protein n=1 Tax=Draconibacterium sp. IB214405 TaxID=3097352 RepID=UPI002A0D395E|nr:SPOR domain-containing protein [Draconibacterium sp. IB214405]MDX8341602.1 SPOR domain-containing protein [Draconibacterium sp. IB214405]